jgi:CspA family cold shock protein
MYTEMQMARGKIIFFNKKSKFGFIKNYDDNKNYYVHGRNFLESAEKEDEVEFELREAKRGMEAIKVKKVDA